MKTRRHLPSLDGLRAFEVAARRLSFTETAQELCITQGAVSQRIKALETEIGQPLFFRRKNGLALTPHGELLAHRVRQAIEHLHEALDGEAAPRPLRVSVLPSFAFCWLMPRLHRFILANPAIRVEMMAQGEVVDLRHADIDLAIRFGPGHYQGLVSERLMGDSIVPVCAPDLLQTHERPRSPADLVGMPILRDAPTEHDGSGTDWATWLAKIGWPKLDLGAGQLFSQADLTIEAAARGLGVALARVSLIGEHLASGRLLRLPMPAVPTPYSYHLIWRSDAGAATEPLRAWLRAEAETVDPSPSATAAWPKPESSAA